VPVLVAGADGCRAGWVVVLWSDGVVHGQVAEDATALGRLAQGLDVLGIDIPIGLKNDGPRTCDLLARRCLGPGRASGVFPAPARGVLDASDYDEARCLSVKACGKSLSRQAFSIVKKIREIDGLVRSKAVDRGRIREVHPEVSFCFWNGGTPMVYRKKTARGRAERLAVVERDFPGAFQQIRRSFPCSKVATDDILDAFAACWSALRIASGRAAVFTAPDERDSCDLVTEIVA
jgi:predicted RNase H-like nuclease